MLKNYKTRPFINSMHEKRSKTETNMNMKLTSQINKQINDHGAYFLDNYITLKAFTKKTLGKI